MPPGRPENARRPGTDPRCRAPAERVRQLAELEPEPEPELLDEDEDDEAEAAAGAADGEEEDDEEDPDDDPLTELVEEERLSVR